MNFAIGFKIPGGRGGPPAFPISPIGGGGGAIPPGGAGIATLGGGGILTGADVDLVLADSNCK